MIAVKMDGSDAVAQVIFYQTGQADRQRPFLPADRTARFAEYRDLQFYEAVLFRHAVYSKGDHDPV